MKFVYKWEQNDRGVSRRMIFVIDIGNTNTVLGIFEEDKLIYEWRIQTDIHKTKDEFAMLIQSLFQFKKLSFVDVEGIIISSVVPPIMRSLETMCLEYFHLTPYVVGKDTMRAPLEITYPNPDRKSTRLNSSHVAISYAVFCLKKKKKSKQSQQ